MKKDEKLSRRELFSFWRREPGVPEPKPEPEPEPEPATRARNPQSAPRLLDPLRPPGAVFDDLLVDTCTRCGLCVDACPRHAIFPLDATFGRAAGTPAIRPREAPCVMCEGLQCTRVCPSKSLARVAPFDVQMGTATVLTDSCVTFHGQPCAVCVTACPVPAALVTDPDGHPVVDALRCTGCGVCENLCPTEPT